MVRMSHWGGSSDGTYTYASPTKRTIMPETQKRAATLKKWPKAQTPLCQPFYFSLVWKRMSFSFALSAYCRIANISHEGRKSKTKKPIELLQILHRAVLFPCPSPLKQERRNPYYDETQS